MQIFMRMGLPQVLTTDQGKEFINQLNDEVMKLLGIRHHLITAYHPEVLSNTKGGLNCAFSHT